jgi:hypothetical protein
MMAVVYNRKNDERIQGENGYKEIDRNPMGDADRKNDRW